jgi:hypothetical protein
VDLPPGGRRALVLHAPVLRFDLLKGLKRPIDGGHELGGRRVLGDNKTRRGALVMFAGATATTVALARVKWFRERLPPDLAGAFLAVAVAHLGFNLAGYLMGARETPL